MKPTHQLRTPPHTDVTAWQYQKTSGIPVWVANNFHDLGSGTLTHRGGAKVKETEWIVAADGSAIVLTAEEFDKCFRPIERGTNEHSANLHSSGAS